MDRACRRPDTGLRDHVGKHLGLLRPCVEELTQRHRLALLLDGLNELPTDQREDKTAAIWRLTQDHAHPCVVVSCRSKDFESPDLRLELDTLTIEPLSPPKVRSFVARYLTAKDGPEGAVQAETLFWHLAGEDLQQMYEVWRLAGLEDSAFWTGEPLPELRPRWWQRLAPGGRRREGALLDLRWRDDHRRRRIADPRSLLKLAARPYFLTMMVFLYRRHGLGAFQGNRSALFQRFVDDVIQRESERHARSENRPHPGRKGIEDALGRLAWTLQRRVGGPGWVQLAMPAAEAESLLGEAQQDLAVGAGLLEWRSTVRFTHQLLQEYFTALGMRAEILGGRLVATELWPSEGWWKPSGWEEAAVFLASLRREDPSLVMDWLSDAHPRLLVQCLEESGCERPSAERLAFLRRPCEPSPCGGLGSGRRAEAPTRVFRRKVSSRRRYPSLPLPSATPSPAQPCRWAPAFAHR